MPDAAVLLRADALDKWFGATHALRRASLDLRAGEIHAVVGANGSGKSTIVKIIAGAYPADSGSVTISDSATALGTVHQNLGLFEEGTVRENICGVLKEWRLSASREREVVDRVLDQLGVSIPPDVAVSKLPLDQRAFVAVARALAKMGDATNAVLVVDEVTSVLRGSAARRFAAVLRRLRDLGTGILLVSHDLDEVLELSDRVTVIVDGSAKATQEASGLHRRALIELMTGAVATEAPAIPAVATSAGSAPVLAVQGLGGDLVEDFDFHVDEGEIVGIIGVPGSGYDETPYLLTGSGSEARRGRVLLRGRNVSSPSAFARAGGSLIPADRNRTALIPSASVLENFMLGYRGGFGRLMRNSRNERARTTTAVRAFGVKCEGPDAPMTSLSGGNQQKLILARCLEANPDLLVVHEPTQGVDVRARADLLAHMHKASVQKGLAVIYVCGDLNELWENVHRVIVVRRGRKVAEVSTATTSKDAVHQILY
ncbi:sugar ABC transporter ATP-binding protein [Rhodococcus sp. T2V]|uniref:ATP-binding cassette domain-containing protein n=1 Tax=Rhodococcus sp. T2V TaxID=3034164 RepID=UPI0023E0C615|nr:sugar ABC transporter ATP-binding protein [Rhodococcus sp. T2V]MDF3311074.1 sugar ABC transporter ATP-binding protein [Rhodococcus sp. T2V]